MFNTAISKLESAVSQVKIDESIENLVKEELQAEFFLDVRKFCYLKCRFKIWK